MAMSEAQKRLRRWFQRHKWHTNDTPTGSGFYLSSPIENSAGLSQFAVDPKTGQRREYCIERNMDIELDRFCCDYVTISIYERKHWWKRDPSIPDGEYSGYSWIPSDDFEEWPRHPNASINIPARDMVKLAELIQAAQADWLSKRKSKNHLNFMERISKQCLCRWIGVNASYDSIKWDYSNERLRKERGWAARCDKPDEED